MVMNPHQTGQHWQPADQDARERALDTRQSFIVQAPAGSGKTGLLVQRYLALLAQVDEPEEILAITFTRKATGEMRERVLQALQNSVSDCPPDAEPFQRQSWQLGRAALARDAEREWSLLAHPSRLRILTIDALNASLTRQLPILSGFGSSPRITDQSQELYRQAARRCLRGDGLNDEHYAAVRTLISHLDGDYGRSEELLAQMLSQRQQWQLFLHLDTSDRDTLEGALEREVAERLQWLDRLLKPVKQLLWHCLQFAAEHVPEDKEPDIARWGLLDAWPEPDADYLAHWHGLIQLLTTNSGSWRKRWNKNQGLPTSKEGKEIKEELAHIVAELNGHPTLGQHMAFVRCLPPAQYRHEQWQLLSALLQVLKLGLAHLQLVFQEQGQVDHPEVALRALQALGDEEQPTDLALKLDYRIRHLLVDEFQDTSRSQVTLLQRLTEGWEPDDGRSLFLVGDPMQSIYRFRQAEVGLFMQAQRDGLGPVDLEGIQLNTNFRSQAAVVAWVNDSFSRLFPSADEADAEQISYSASAVARDDPASGAAVALHPLLGERSDTLQQEAEQVAQLAAATLNDEQHPQADVAVLVRRRNDLLAIIPALRRAGLAFEAVEIESLAGQPVVQDLYALTRALMHAGDVSAWAAVLRAPWCGLELAALDTWLGPRPVQPLQALSQLCERLPLAQQQGLPRVLPILLKAHQQRRRLALRTLVEATWRQLGGAACLRDERERADADAFFQLLENLDVAGDCDDPVALVERLQALYARPDASPEAARLKLMTIHKAKGLEFDTVILPGLGQKGPSGSQGLLLWQERTRPNQEMDLLIGPLQAKGDDSDPIQQYIRALDAEQQRQEQLRLLYVATTRAQRCLHLLGAVKTPEDDSAPLKPPPSGSLLAELWPLVSADFERAWTKQQAIGVHPQAQSLGHGQDQLALFAHNEMMPRPYRRLSKGWLLPPPPASVRWPKRPSPASLEDTTPFAWAGMRARHIGTVVHAWLERMANDGVEQWTAERVQQDHRLISHRLRLLGVPQQHLSQATLRVSKALQMVLHDERGRWVLQHHTESSCELAFNAWLDGRLQTLIIDRTFVDEHNVRWIVDYKTSAYEGDRLQHFISHEKARYQKQLNNYARVMQKLEGRSVRTALYLPLMPLFIEVEHLKAV